MSKLVELEKYPLALWNDSAVTQEMRDAVAMKCLGGTSNPPLILKAAQSDEHWANRARELAESHTSKEAAKMLANEIRIAAAHELLPVFRKTGGKQGRMFVQVDPRNHNDPDAMVAEALELNQLAPNIAVKMPLISTGLVAMRRALEQGIWATGSVSFTYSQVMAVTNMYADFLKSWKGADTPSCCGVLMVGRLDDYLKILNQERGLNVPESIITQAGVAVAKRTYKALRQRNIPLHLQLAAPRGLYHITEFLEMDVSMTAGLAIRQLAYDSPDLIQPGDGPTEEAIETLKSAFPEFTMAYEPDGLTPEEFVSYGATQKTLNQFIDAQNGLEQFVCECAKGALV